MNKLEKWFLKRLLAKLVKQGYFKDAHIRVVYWMIRDAWANEFAEDNIATRNTHLRELFEQTQGLSNQGN